MAWPRTLWHSVHGCNEQDCYFMIPRVQYKHTQQTTLQRTLITATKTVPHKMLYANWIRTAQTILHLRSSWSGRSVVVQSWECRHVVSVRMRTRGSADWRISLHSNTTALHSLFWHHHIIFTGSDHVQIFSTIFKNCYCIQLSKRSHKITLFPVLQWHITEFPCHKVLLIIFRKNNTKG